MRFKAWPMRLKVWPVLLVLGGWVWIPFIPFTVLGNTNRALLFAIVAVSLVLLTGWVGQISLAQAAFVGVGAFGTALLAQRGLSLPFPFSLPVAAAFAGGLAMLLGVVALRVRGLYLAVATLIFAWVADQYLFSSPWLAGAGGVVSIDVDPVGAEGGYPSFDFSDRRIFYYVALAVLALAIVGFVNLRQSKTGRAFFAVRGSEMAAASLGIDVTRYKLLAFAISGFVAGMAGNLAIVSQGAVVADEFAFTQSIFFLAVAVVGGLHSLGGAVASSFVFAFLNELFFRVDALAGWLEVVSAMLLAVVVLFYPGGLAAAGSRLRDALERRMASRLAVSSEDEGRPQAEEDAEALTAAADDVGSEVSVEVAGLDETVELRPVPNGGEQLETARPDEVPDVLVNLRPADLEELQAAGGGGRNGARKPESKTKQGAEADPEASPATGLSGSVPRQRIASFRLPPSRKKRPLVLQAEKVTVRFGGLVAVNEASLEVRENEIVGLIGANGAGKTTFFNAMAGFVEPQEGMVELNGRDISSLSVHERAGLGVGRTFQLIQLFPQLTVFDNLLVATHIRNPSGFLAHLVVTNGAASIEAQSVERVERVIALLGLQEVADRRVTGLPFGTLRMVELGRALVTGSPLVMLDEPASGLDSQETDGFADLLRYLRATLGLTLLLIEHDVGLVMSVCDYVYVLDRGQLIAQGTPKQVKRDPAVMAAYLGTSKEAPTKKRPAPSASGSTRRRS